ncbi:HD domain-containing protein [Methanopyrus kandleri]
MESKHLRFLRALDEVVSDLPERVLRRLCRLHDIRGHRGDTRLEHSLKVAYLCWRLSGKFRVDGKIALESGLLHDIGYGIPRCPLCKLDPGGHCGICHWRTGSELLEEVNVDPAVVRAVRRHMFPYGPPPRTPLDWCVWTSDKLESVLSFLGFGVLPDPVLKRAVSAIYTLS